MVDGMADRRVSNTSSPCLAFFEDYIACMVVGDAMEEKQEAGKAVCGEKAHTLFLATTTRLLLVVVEYVHVAIINAGESVGTD